MNDRVCETSSTEQTVTLGRELGRALRKRGETGVIVALNGTLGAGKTQFVRGLAEGLGIDARQVCSPTFVLCQEYEDDTCGQRLIHIDCYRMEGESELESIGFDEIIEAADSIIAIEWAERIASAIPHDSPGGRIDVRIEHLSESQRRIMISCQNSLPLQTERETDKTDTDSKGKESACPICGKAVSRTPSTYPFCSSRCRTIDLGNWLSDRYTISRELREEDFEDESQA